MKKQSSARPFLLRLPTRRIGFRLLSRLGEGLIVASLIAAAFIGFPLGAILFIAGLVLAALEPQSPVTLLLGKISKLLRSSVKRMVKKRE